MFPTAVYPFATYGNCDRGIFGSFAGSLLVHTQDEHPTVAGDIVVRPPEGGGNKRVIALSSMVTDAELRDEQECIDIIDDAKAEASKHGIVENILLLKADVEHNSSVPEFMVASARRKIILRFTSAEAASAAAQHLHGKKFDGRTVEAEIFEEAVFDTLRVLPHYTC